MTTTQTPEIKKTPNGVWIYGKGNYFNTIELARKDYQDTKSPNWCNPVTVTETIDGVEYFQVHATNVWD